MLIATCTICPGRRLVNSVLWYGTPEYPECIRCGAARWAVGVCGGRMALVEPQEAAQAAFAVGGWPAVDAMCEAAP